MPTLPLTFIPIYQKRVWGGRELAKVYGRQLPCDSAPYGESWEISDREDEQSIVATGPYAGKSLHALWCNHREEVFGKHLTDTRFPLLIKILDARDDLSIQVHPPAHIAHSLGGEAKTETWYIANAEENASIFVGLKHGTTKEQFEHALNTGSCADLVHELKPKAGEFIHIPSGRIHAIGAGLLIYEIQQSSDTTYRVFDWNRIGLSGEPRPLHIKESLQCIDFDDFEPEMDTPDGETIAKCEHYQVRQKNLSVGEKTGNPEADRFSILTVISGNISDASGTSYKAGDFMLLPVGAAPLTATSNARVLITTVPR